MIRINTTFIHYTHNITTFVRIASLQMFSAPLSDELWDSLNESVRVVTEINKATE